MTFRLPEPDFELVGFSHRAATPHEIARWHGEWHRDNPQHGICENPGTPMTLAKDLGAMPARTYGLLTSGLTLLAYIAWLFVR